MLELKKKKNQEGKEMLRLGSQQKMCFGHHRHVFISSISKTCLKSYLHPTQKTLKLDTFILLSVSNCKIFQASLNVIPQSIIQGQ